MKEYVYGLDFGKGESQQLEIIMEKDIIKIHKAIENAIQIKEHIAKFCKSKAKAMFEKGDIFNTPSGQIKILSIVKESNKHGKGYKISRDMIIDFEEFHENVKKGLWNKI